jgi:hypothetical protein
MNAFAAVGVHGFRGCRLTIPTGLNIIAQGKRSATLGYFTKRNPTLQGLHKASVSDAERLHSSMIAYM